MIDPFTNEIRARNDPEVAVFFLDEVAEGGAVQLFQIREIQ
jgi:hypothetical protein